MVEKRVNKFGQGLPPPFRAMPERNRFFSWEVFPNSSGSLNKVRMQPTVSLPNSRIPLLSRSHLDLLLCFPPRPVLVVLAADCLNRDLDLYARLSRLRQGLMKAIRAVCLPQYAGAPTKPRLSGSYQPSPTAPSLMSFVFPVFSES